METFSALAVIFAGIILLQIVMVSRPLDLSTEDQILKSVNAKKAKELVDGGIKIIDVRTPGEYNRGRIKGAKNCDIYNDFSNNIQKFKKEVPYLIYCQNGFRSRNGLKIMKNLDFKEVYELSGGISSWISNGFSIKS